MDHKKKLVEGAKQCLIKRGYARTTARDIVTESGSSLASIGYHYGSKDALLNEALIQLNQEWGTELEQAVQAADLADATTLERFEIILRRVVELFSSNRQLWASNFEAFAQIEHVPEVRKVLADGLREACRGLGAAFASKSNDDPQVEHALGYFSQALLNGVMAQWLIDPESAPSGDELAFALRVIAQDVQPKTSRKSD